MIFSLWSYFNNQKKKKLTYILHPFINFKKQRILNILRESHLMEFYIYFNFFIREKRKLRVLVKGFLDKVKLLSNREGCV